MSSKPRVSKLEFFVALALVALAQAGKGRASTVLKDGDSSDAVGDAQTSASSRSPPSHRKTHSPNPHSTLTRLQPTLSAIPPAAPLPRRSTAQTVRAPLPAYSSDDPWNANPRYPAAQGGSGADGLPNGAASSLAGTGLPNEWWKKQENIKVSILGQQGFILNRYTVYEVASDVSVSEQPPCVLCALLTAH